MHPMKVMIVVLEILAVCAAGIICYGTLCLTDDSHADDNQIISYDKDTVETILAERYGIDDDKLTETVLNDIGPLCEQNADEKTIAGIIKRDSIRYKEWRYGWQYESGKENAVYDDPNSLHLRTEIAAGDYVRISGEGTSMTEFTMPEELILDKVYQNTNGMSPAGYKRIGYNGNSVDCIKYTSAYGTYYIGEHGICYESISKLNGAVTVLKDTSLDLSKGRSQQTLNESDYIRYESTGGFLTYSANGTGEIVLKEYNAATGEWSVQSKFCMDADVICVAENTEDEKIIQKDGCETSGIPASYLLSFVSYEHLMITLDDIGYVTAKTTEYAVGTETEYGKFALDVDTVEILSNGTHIICKVYHSGDIVFKTETEWDGDGEYGKETFTLDSTSLITGS